MQATTSIPPLDTLSEGQRSALVRLLADDDPEIFRNIHDGILAQGRAALAWLEPYQLSPDPSTRRRVRAIVNQLQANDADNTFLSFCLTQGERLDFEHGLFLLAQTEYTDINPEGYRALIDGYAEEILNRVATVKVPQRVLGTLNRLLFLQLGFRGNAADYYDPENSYLNRVLDRRTGNPLLLSAVYLGICQRLGLPVAGVGLPGHFLCRFQDAAHEIYVDPFNGGRFLTRTDCVHHLVRSNRNLTDDYLSPLSPKRMLFRTVHNLHQIYQQRNEVRSSLRMRGYLVALADDAQKNRPA
jgi:regulator of sirC expression with transglutaminase-like and TPR domain